MMGSVRIAYSQTKCFATSLYKYSIFNFAVFFTDNQTGFHLFSMWTSITIIVLNSIVIDFVYKYYSVSYVSSYFTENKFIHSFLSLNIV